jgi:hypothetical protein
MAARTPINCSIDNTENLSKIVTDEIGEIFEQANNTIASIEQLIENEGINSSVDECEASLQNLLSAGDNGGSAFQYVDQMPPLFGIDGPNTQEDDERYIFDNTACVLTNGIYFKKTTLDSAHPNNIETLRRVYNSVGRDLSKVEAEVTNQTDVSYRFRIVAASLDPNVSNQSIPLSEIRIRLNDNTITKSDYVELFDKSIIMVKKVPLLVPDLTDSEIPKRYGFDNKEITGTIIHKGSAKNTTSIINKWINQGFGEELPSILDGEDPSSDIATISPLFKEVQSLSGKLLTTLEYYKSRFNSINPTTARNRIDQSLIEIEMSIKQLISVFLTEVSVITEFDTLTKLRMRLTDNQIEYLLLNQKYVVGIDLDANEDEILQLFMATMAQLPGDSGPSSRRLNTPVPLRDQNYSIILLCLSDVLSAIEANNQPLTSQVIDQLILIITTLNSRTLVDSLPPPTPVQGYPCYNTPGFIALQRTNYIKNFNISLKIGQLDNILADLKALYDRTIGTVIENVLRAIATAAQTAIRMVNQLRDKLLAQIAPLKRKLAAFISKYLTLIGQGNFDSSVFKCAVDFNLGLNTGILEALEVLITALAEKINQLIARLLNELIPLIDNILCKPLAMIDGFVGSANNYIPPFCTIKAPQLLTDEAIKYLRDIRSIVGAQGAGFTAFSGSLVSLRAEVNSAPDRLDTFRNGATCMGQTASTLMSGSLVNIRAFI